MSRVADEGLRQAGGGGRDIVPGELGLAETLDDRTIVIVAGADDRFAIGLTVTLFSALRHLDPTRQAHVFVLDGGLSADSRARVSAALGRARGDVEVTFVDNDPDRFASYSTHGYARAAYLRLMIAEVVPDRYRQVLYLDSDVVVSGDIARLWALPDEGMVFRAAVDEGVYVKSYVPTFDFTDFPAGTPYFNSGVMLIDLPRWKANRVAELAQGVLDDHSDQCLAVDQDALNIVCQGKWSVLPPAWNFQVAGGKHWADLALDDPAIGITHFLDFKPWNRETFCLRQDVFDDALQASGWYTWQEFAQYRLNKRIDSLRRSLRTAPARKAAGRIKRDLALRAQRALALSARVPPERL